MILSEEQINEGRTIANDLNRWADIRDQLSEKPDRTGPRLNNNSLRRAVKFIHEVIAPPKAVLISQSNIINSQTNEKDDEEIPEHKKERHEGR